MICHFKKEISNDQPLPKHLYYKRVMLVFANIKERRRPT